MLEMHGPAGQAWLDRLPRLVVACTQRWGLRLEAPFAELSYNYATPATDGAGRPVVLKICYPNPEFPTEVDALRLFDGRGAVRLLAADMDDGAMLLERAVPGTPLSEVADDGRATSIAAGVMRQLWRPVPAIHAFPSVARWVGNMSRQSRHLMDPSSPAWGWVQRALALYGELSSTDAKELLLHGDLHQGNILAANRETWLAIDPKGVTGPPVWETGPLLINVLPERVDSPEGRRVLLRRADQLADELGCERDRLRAWGVVRAVLAGFWTLEDEGYFDEWALEVAAVLSRP